MRGWSSRSPGRHFRPIPRTLPCAACRSRPARPPRDLLLQAPRSWRAFRCRHPASNSGIRAAGKHFRRSARQVADLRGVQPSTRAMAALSRDGSSSSHFSNWLATATAPCMRCSAASVVARNSVSASLAEVLSRATEAEVSCKDSVLSSVNSPMISFGRRLPEASSSSLRLILPSASRNSSLSSADLAWAISAARQTTRPIARVPQSAANAGISQGGPNKAGGEGGGRASSSLVIAVSSRLAMPLITKAGGISP